MPAVRDHTASSNNTFIQLYGSKNFRDRIICSTLSGKRIKIDNIRDTVTDTNTHIGLYEYEINFLRLIELITDNTIISINSTGTAIKYKPGIITGGYNLTHQCSLTRGIGYYIEPIIKLLLFAKNIYTDIRFINCITNNNQDITVDILRTVTTQLCHKFGIDDKIELRCDIRGAEPLGGGDVYVKIPSVKQLHSINWCDEGLVKRVRGLAYTSKCTPQYSNRMIDTTRELLNKLIPDVYIYTDHYKGKNAGLSSGYAISLVAETTTGVLYSAERCGDIHSNPEVVGNTAAKLLLSEISNGGCIDTVHQSYILLLMCLTSEDVSKVRLGKLSQYTIECLRLYKLFFNVQFKLSTEPNTHTIFASCVGTGYKNINRKVA